MVNMKGYLITISFVKDDDVSFRAITYEVSDGCLQARLSQQDRPAHYKVFPLRHITEIDAKLVDL